MQSDATAEIDKRKRKPRRLLYESSSEEEQEEERVLSRPPKVKRFGKLTIKNIIVIQKVHRLIFF